MTKRIISDLEFGKLNPNILHFITTNADGKSVGSYSSFNLGKWCGEDVFTTQENYGLLASEIGIEDNAIFIPREIHSNITYIIDDRFLKSAPSEQEFLLSKADALVTKQPHIAIGVTTADCVPIIGFDEENTIVAIHAGWRGIIAGVIDSAIAKMQEISTSKRYHFLVGPCIDGMSYEVGVEVWEQFRNKFQPEELNQILKKQTDEKFFVDIRTAATIQLGKYTNNSNIKHIRIDTFTNPQFYSVRRDGLKTGRFVTGIALKNSE